MRLLSEREKDVWLAHLGTANLAAYNQGNTSTLIRAPQRPVERAWEKEGREPTQGELKQLADEQRAMLRPWLMGARQRTVTAEQAARETAAERLASKES